MYRNLFSFVLCLTLVSGIAMFCPQTANAQLAAKAVQMLFKGASKVAPKVAPQVGKAVPKTVPKVQPKIATKPSQKPATPGEYRLVPCLNCGGDGRIENAYGTADCNVCRGTGRRLIRLP